MLRITPRCYFSLRWLSAFRDHNPFRRTSRPRESSRQRSVRPSRGKPLWLSACTLALLSACTAEEIYNQVQQDHERQCRLLPVWQQEHCLSLNDTSWEEYNRTRQQTEPD